MAVPILITVISVIAIAVGVTLVAAFVAMVKSGYSK
jgi:hypothetical protein